LEGRYLAPEQAHALGLVDEVVAPATLVARALELATARTHAPFAYTRIKQALIAPIVEACDRHQAAENEAFLDTWFSERARTLIAATVARITKR
jgi:enoyl-CoA hydratase